jgi:hypothetical protein
MRQELDRLMSLLVLHAPQADNKGAPVKVFVLLALLARSAIVQMIPFRVFRVLQACSRTLTMKCRVVLASRENSKSPSGRHSATFAPRDISTPTRGNTHAVLATVAASLGAQRPLAQIATLAVRAPLAPMNAKHVTKVITAPRARRLLRWRQCKA